MSATYAAFFAFIAGLVGALLIAARPPREGMYVLGALLLAYLATAFLVWQANPAAWSVGGRLFALALSVIAVNRAHFAYRRKLAMERGRG